MFTRIAPAALRLIVIVLAPLSPNTVSTPFVNVAVVAALGGGADCEHGTGRSGGADQQPAGHLPHAPSDHCVHLSVLPLGVSDRYFARDGRIGSRLREILRLLCQGNLVTQVLDIENGSDQIAREASSSYVAGISPRSTTTPDDSGPAPSCWIVTVIVG